MGDGSGEITVAADLSGQAGTTVTLTVVAWNDVGGGRKAPVEVTVTESCDSRNDGALLPHAQPFLAPAHR